MIKFFNYNNDEKKEIEKIDENVTQLTNKKTIDELAKEYVNSYTVDKDGDKDYTFSCKRKRKLINKHLNNFALFNPRHDYYDIQKLIEICHFEIKNPNMKIFENLFKNKLRLTRKTTVQLIENISKTDEIELIETIINDSYQDRDDNKWLNFDNVVDMCITRFDFMKDNLNIDHSMDDICSIAQLCYKVENLIDFVDGEKSLTHLEIIRMGLINLDSKTVTKIYNKYENDDDKILYYHMKATAVNLNGIAHTLSDEVIKRYLINPFRSSKFDYSSYNYSGYMSWSGSGGDYFTSDLVDMIVNIKSDMIWSSINTLLEKCLTDDICSNVVSSLLNLVSHRNIETSFNEKNIENLISLNSDQRQQIRLGLDDDLNVSCYTDLNNSAETMQMVRENLRQEKVDELSNKCNGD